MNIARFIAWRYLRSSSKDSTVAFMMRICFLGIFIGTFALMMTLIITNGFEATIQEKMQGINADIIITPPLGNRLDLDQLRPQLLAQFSDRIAAIAGNSTRYVILDHDKQQTLVMLRGIEPTEEAHVTTFAQHVATQWPYLLMEQDASLQKKLTHGAPLPEMLADDGVIIGYKLAQNYNLLLGETVTIYVPEPSKTKKIYLKKHTVRIAGFFRFGLEDYDSGFAFCSLSLLRTLFEEAAGVDQIAIKQKAQPPLPCWKKLFSRAWWHSLIESDYAEKKLIKQLEQALPALNIASWKSLYLPLLESLKLEKYVSFFILALITLVASLNMVSLLVLYIQQKRRDIAILEAMGMRKTQMRTVFIYIGMLITTTASVSGLLAAAIGGWLLERYPFIRLPDVYYISHLPARMSLDLFVIVFVCTLVIGLLSSWLPAQRAKRISIMQVLRSE